MSCRCMTVAMYDVMEPLICCVERNCRACPCDKKKSKAESETHMGSNARDKPRRSAKHGGHPQAQLVGVGLTKQLGWWLMRCWKSYSPSARSEASTVLMPS